VIGGSVVDKSETREKKKIIFSCSGAANVGFLAHRAAAELVEEGFARPSCLAGIGAHLKGFLKAAADSSNIVIDGCAVACGKTILEHASIPVALHLVITDLGIEKKMTSDIPGEDVDRVKELLQLRWAAAESGKPGRDPFDSGEPPCGCST